MTIAKLILDSNTPPFAPSTGSAGSNPFAVNFNQNISLPPIDFSCNNLNFNFNGINNNFLQYPVNAPVFTMPELGMPPMNFSPIGYNSPTFTLNTTTAIGDTFTRTTTPSAPRVVNRSNFSGTMSDKLVKQAKSYIGRVNSDSEGNRLFSGGENRKWCADFTTYCARNIYGNKLPSDFGSSSVTGLMNWGKQNSCFNSLPSNKSKRAEYILANVKPGDIMIEKSNGKSHTGIVTKVNSDGSINVVSGNCSNSVKETTYDAKNAGLTGFISLDNFA